MSAYRVLLCPVCLEQVAEPDYEYGSDDHTHDGVDVETIEVDPLASEAELRSHQDLALFRLEQESRGPAFAQAERDWYDNLSVADRFWEDSRRKRVERERREARPKLKGAGAFERALADVWTGEAMNAMLFAQGSFLDQINRNRGNDLDEWLASERPILGVAATLGVGA